MNYYPWNSRALASWVKQELEFYGDLKTFSQFIGIDRNHLYIWLTSSPGDITVPINRQHVLSIGRFRNWPESQVVAWLEIQPQHWQALVSAESVSQ